jgi:hypothetical protein
VMFFRLPVRQSVICSRETISFTLEDHNAL